jgi:hypothetical protein
MIRVRMPPCAIRDGLDCWNAVHQPVGDSLNIAELRNKWDLEKENYRSQEVGSGVHGFVRECLQSPDLFGLSEGSLATPVGQRRREYIHENRALEGRRADFVLYVDPDVIVPLEVERWGNIAAGIEQIQQYQVDFDRLTATYAMNARIATVIHKLTGP